MDKQLYKLTIFHKGSTEDEKNFNDIHSLLSYWYKNWLYSYNEENIAYEVTYNNKLMSFDSLNALGFFEESKKTLYNKGDETITGLPLFHENDLHIINRRLLE